MKILKPEAPPIPPPPPPPSPTSPDAATAAKTRQAMDDAAANERKAKGRAATLLTSGQGDTSQATTAKKTLLPG